MDNQEKNIVDKFLDVYDKNSNKKTEYRRIYVKPTKLRSLIGFVFGLIMFIIVLGFFAFDLMYFLLFFGCLIVTIYYGINLFTEKGIGLPRTVVVPVEEEKKTEDNDNYKVQ